MPDGAATYHSKYEKMIAPNVASAREHARALIDAHDRARSTAREVERDRTRAGREIEDETICPDPLRDEAAPTAVLAITQPGGDAVEERLREWPRWRGHSRSVPPVTVRLDLAMAYKRTSARLGNIPVVGNRC